MPVTHKNEIPETLNKKKVKNKKSKKKYRKSHFFSYLYLFSFVFLGALWGVSYLIKSYSPQIDVEIGNNDTFLLNEADVDTEVKTVDERLKWIQMEDDMPSVSIRGINKSEKMKESLKVKEIKNSENIVKEVSNNNHNEEFKYIPPKEIVIPQPIKHITKVYLGNYATIEEAQAVKDKLNGIEPDIAPFIKPVKGYFIVQIGSFTDSDRAGALVEKIREKGYYPKTNYEN